MNVKFYTQHCPKCKVLKAKLDQKEIPYEEITDFDIKELSDRGVRSLPVLEIDGELMDFTDAMQWARSQQ